jgi:transposase-like protein
VRRDWSFCYAKARNVPQQKKGDGSGDVWTWTALDADTKLILSYMVTGDRQMGAAMDFMRDVAERVDKRLQVTTDGHQPYAIAVGEAFGWNV